MSEFNQSSSRIEKLISNINDKNSEIRERAVQNLLSKLELEIIPLEIIISHYHNLIGECLIFLNDYQTVSSERFISKIIKILTFFLKTKEGKNVVEKYGTIEFLSDFLKYRVNNDSELRIIVEEFLSELLSSKKHKVNLGDKNSESLNTKKEVIKSESFEEKFNYRHLLQNLTNHKNSLFFSNFDNEIIVSDQDRSFLITTITKLKFINFEQVNIEEEIIQDLLKIFNNLPIEIFFNHFTELFYDLLNLFTQSNNFLILSLFFKSLINNIKNNIAFKKNCRYEKKLKNFNCEDEKINFIENSYPSLIKNKKSINLKITIDNIIEVLLRLFWVFFIKKKDFFITEDILNFIKFLYNSDICKEKLNLLIVESLNFFSDLFLKVKIEEDMQILRGLNFIFEMLNFLESSEKEYSFVKKNLIDFLLVHVYSGFVKENEILFLNQILIKFNSDSSVELENYLKMKNNISNIKNHQLLIYNNNYKNEKSLFEDVKKNVEFIQDKIFGFLKLEKKENIEILVESFLLISFLEKQNTSMLYDCIELIRNFKKEFLKFFEISILDSNYQKISFQILSFWIELLKNNKKIRIHNYEIDLNQLLLNFMKEFNILDFLIINSLEENTNLILNESFISLLSFFVQFGDEIKDYCDLFLFANYLILMEANTQCKSYLEYLKTKNFNFELIYNFFGLFNKEEKNHNLNFEKILLTNNKKKYVNRKNDFYLYEEILDDYNKQELIIKNELMFKKNNLQEFLTKEDLENLYDILNIFLNTKLDEIVRVQSFEQILEIISVYKQNPELSEFLSCVINVILEKLFKEENFQFFELYIKIIASFFVNFKYNKTLKMKIVKIIRKNCLETNFEFLKTLVFYIGKSSLYNFNALLIIQIVLFNCEIYTENYELIFKKMENKFEQKNEKQLIIKTSLFFRFWDFNKNCFLNLYEGKKYIFKEDYFILKKYNPKFFVNKNFLESLQDQYDNNTKEILKEELRKLSHFSKNFTSFKDFQYLFFKLKEIEKFSEKHEIFILRNEIKTFLKSIKIYSNEILAQENHFLKLQLFLMSQSFVENNSDSDYSLEFYNSFLKNFAICLVREKNLFSAFTNFSFTISSFSNFITEQNFDKMIQNFNSQNFSLILPFLLELKNEVLLSQKKSILSNINEFFILSNPNEFKTKIAFSIALKIINKIISNYQDFNIVENFDLLIHIKKLFTSKFIEIRILAVNCYIIVVNFIDKENANLIEEILLKTELEIKNTIDKENKVVLEMNLNLHCKVLKKTQKKNFRLALILKNFLEKENKKMSFLFFSNIINYYNIVFSENQFLDIKEDIFYIISNKIEEIEILEKNEDYLVLVFQYLNLIHQNFEEFEKQKKILFISNKILSNIVKADFSNNNILEKISFLILRVISQLFHKGLLDYEIMIKNICFIFSRIQNENLKNFVINNIAIILKKIISLELEINLDVICIEKKLVFEIIFEMIHEQILKSNFSIVYFILPMVFLLSKKSKEIFLGSKIFEEIKIKFKLDLRNKNLSDFNKLLKCFNYLFIENNKLEKISSSSFKSELKENRVENLQNPSQKATNQNILTKINSKLSKEKTLENINKKIQIIEKKVSSEPSTKCLKEIYSILYKIKITAVKEEYDQMILKILKNWYLNTSYNYYLEKIMLSGQDFLSLNICSILKNDKKVYSSDFITSLNFVLETAESPVFQKFVFKNQILQSFGQTLVGFYNSKNFQTKKKQFLKISKIIFKIFEVFSFYPISHDKIISSTEITEAILFFFNEEFQKNMDKDKKENDMRIFYVIFCNLFLSKCSKNQLKSQKHFIEKICFKLKTENNVFDLTLLSQLLYNLIFKDAGVVSDLNKEELNEDITLILKINQKKLISIQNLLENQLKNKEMKQKYVVKLLDNLNSVRNILILD